MSDPKLVSSEDGATVEYINGLITMSDGLENAARLSLFGGNTGDSGRDAHKSIEFWGNKIETQKSRKLRSRTQYLLETLPLTSGNLPRFREAAEADLTDTFSDVADTISAAASIPSVNTLTITANIVIKDKNFKFAFTESRSTK